MEQERAVRGLFHLLLHIFFKKITVVGAEHVPAEGPLVLVGNHENGLLDPLLLLVASDRPARFLAKAPLFHHPLVAPFLRLLKALPVYRRKDEGSDMSRNQATFEACEHLLLDGEALALFPEGVSHDEPHLMPLKTGAARIVGRAYTRGARPVLLPAGLLYSAKATFRSEVTVTFGIPLAFEDLPWGAGENSDAVEALTDRLGEALKSLTLNAERWEDLRLVERLRPMALELAGVTEDGRDETRTLRTLVEKFYRARMEHPTQTHALLAKARAYLKMLDLLGLQDGDVARDVEFGAAFGYTWRRLLLLVAGYPPALYGWLFNFIPYFFTGRLATVAGKTRDAVATYKLYAGMAFFPLFYILQGAFLWWGAGPWWAVTALALGAPCGLWATRYYALRSSFVRLAAATITLRTRARTAGRLKGMRGEVVEALGPLVEMYK